MAKYTMLSIADLKKKSKSDLAKEIQKAQAELSQRRLHVRSGEDKQSHMIADLRHYIARIHTLTTQNQENEE